MSFETATVIISGASRGIGREIALAFAAQTEHSLLLIARSEDKLTETKQLCLEAGAAGAATIPCDLTDAEAVAALSLPKDFPGPAIIINNAGSYLYKKLEDTRLEEFREQIDTNLYSAVHLTQRFLKEFKERQRGLIINICSVGALQGLKESGAYASAKHALLGYSRSLRQELLETGVAVTAVNLGQTQSTSWKDSDIDPRRLVDPKDVARLLVTLSQFSARTVVEEIILNPQHGRVPPM